jgi:hypothetical protein
MGGSKPGLLATTPVCCIPLSLPLLVNKWQHYTRLRGAAAACRRGKGDALFCRRAVALLQCSVSCVSLRSGSPCHQIETSGATVTAQAGAGGPQALASSQPRRRARGRTAGTTIRAPRPPHGHMIHKTTSRVISPQNILHMISF